MMMAKTATPLGFLRQPLLAHIVVLTLGFGAPAADASQILRIATWDLTHADAAVFKPAKSKPPKWRHTFGSERHDRKKTRLGVFNLDIDVVLLQGVRHIRGLRRIFPPRYWKLIVSRDYMAMATPLSRLPADLQAFDIATLDPGGSAPVTAIAVRYQRGLRVRGIDHISIKKWIQNDHVPNIRSPKSTAALLNYYGSHVWIVSMRRPELSCDAAMPCTKWDDLKTALSQRIERRTRRQHPIVAGIAGVDDTDKNTTQLDMSNAQCGRLSPISDHKKSHMDLGHLHQRTRKKLGCIVIGDIKLLQPLPPQLPLTPPTQGAILP